MLSLHTTPQQAFKNAVKGYENYLATPYYATALHKDHIGAAGVAQTQLLGALYNEVVGLRSETTALRAEVGQYLNRRA